MNVNELRVGNLLEYGDGFIRVDINVLRDLNVYLQSGLKPIRLTVEWLLKAGFKYNDGIYENEKNTFSLNTLYELDWYELAPCKYVHQLQNLYFALIGEELIFNNIEI